MQALKISSVKAIADEILAADDRPRRDRGDEEQVDVRVVSLQRQADSRIQGHEADAGDQQNAQQREEDAPSALPLGVGAGRERQVAAENEEVDQQEQHQYGDHPAALDGLAELLDRDGVHAIARRRCPGKQSLHCTSPFVTVMKTSSRSICRRRKSMM